MKVFTIIACCSEISFILIRLAKAAPWFVYLGSTISIGIFSVVGTIIYEKIKMQNHREIIIVFLNMEDDIRKLEILLN